jgi:hypothetical protein
MLFPIYQKKSALWSHNTDIGQITGRIKHFQMGIISLFKAIAHNQLHEATKTDTEKS